MKNIKIVIILLMMLFITGCASINESVTINKDKSMNIDIIVLLKDQNLKKLVSFEKIEKEIKNNGYKVEDYSLDNKNGYRISKYIKNIDDVSLSEDVSYDLNISSIDNNYFFKVEKGIFKNKYIAVFNTKNLVNYLNNSTYSSYLNNIDVTFSVKLPYSPIFYNASKIDGEILTWSLNDIKNNDINFTFELFNMMNIYMALLGILVIIILLTISIFEKRKNRPIKEVNPIDKIKKDNKYIQTEVLSDYSI